MSPTAVKGTTIVPERFIIAYIDNKKVTDINSVLSILRTIFVCICLAGAALYFVKDMNTIILTPIENMVKKIETITVNPINAAIIQEKEAYVWHKLYSTNKEALRLKEEQKQYETSQLEQIIVKIGALLAVGFGEAGSNIISANINRSDAINPIIPGQKILAIFGFCDIRSFTDATEVLQENVMIFVNEIAEIVHDTVDKYDGAPNKNIGDAFLLVWKMHQDMVMNDPETMEPSINPANMRRINVLADLSVFSFVKILIKIQKSKQMEKYALNENMQERIPNFQVRMGFGLNFGWAIEGPIGSKVLLLFLFRMIIIRAHNRSVDEPTSTAKPILSRLSNSPYKYKISIYYTSNIPILSLLSNPKFKIDTSYLSPHVNLASRLEAATKQFGIPILISDNLYRLCSFKIQNYLRHIDCVTVKGSKVPMDLYTFDGDFEVLNVDNKNIAKKFNNEFEQKRDRVTKSCSYFLNII